jgi:hypothetical protein
MPVNCDPSSLANAARCFASCIPPGEFEAVKVYLICEFANKNVTPTMPAVPGNLDVADASVAGNTILTWTNSDTPATNEIWKSVNGGAFALYGSVSGGTHTFTDIAAMPVLDFWDYEVRACSGVLCSSFSSTRSVANGITRTGQASVTLSFPTLVLSYRAVLFDAMPNLTSFSAPLLRRVDGTQVRGALSTLLTSMNLNSLVSVPTGDFNMAGIGLCPISLPALTTVGLSFYFAGANITSMSAPVLVTVGNMAVFDNCPSIVTLSFPSLVTVTNGFTCPGANALTSLSLPAFTNSPGGNPDFSSCTALATLDIRNLSNFSGILAGGSAISSLNVSNMIIPDTGLAMDFNNNAILVGSSAGGTGVDGVLRRGVASGITTDFIDLSGGANAVPDASGQVDKAALIGSGNTVLTN